jgi:hypothetical protein
MKRCNFNKKMLSRFIDNDLLTEQKNNVENHLSNCDYCKSVYADYLAIGSVIRSNAADSLKPVFLKCRKPVRHWFPDNLFSPGVVFPVSALLIIAITFNALLLTGNIIKSNKEIPLLSQNSKSSIMNTLLGSIIYYEEYDKSTVHSQFFHLSPGISDTVETKDPEDLKYLTYNSPLFSDNNYEAILEQTIQDAMEK